MSADPLHADPPSDVYFNREMDAWIVSRYSDVASALNDARLTAGVTDGDWHRRYRSAMRELVSRADVVAWEQEAIRICRSAKLEDHFDVVTKFAVPWCESVAYRLTGAVNPAAVGLARVIYAAAAEPFDLEQQRQAGLATQELASALPGTAFVQAFVAVSQSIAACIGNVVFALLSAKQRLAAIQTRAHVDELLRYAAPSKAQLRQAAAEMPVGAAHIGKGERVVLLLASANRDPSIFANPHHLDLDRDASRHLAFGSGLHACMGASLTHTCVGIAFRVLADRFPNARLLSARGKTAFALRSLESVKITSEPEALPSRIPHPDQR